jgi:hypothetical protein
MGVVGGNYSTHRSSVFRCEASGVYPRDSLTPLSLSAHARGYQQRQQSVHHKHQQTGQGRRQIKAMFICVSTFELLKN